MSNEDNDSSNSQTRINTLSTILSEQYGVKNDRLVTAIVALGEATAKISLLLRNYTKHKYAGTQNTSGDDQLELDINCDNAVFEAIRQSGVYSIAASEETPVETPVGPPSDASSSSNFFSLGFDPLDGSSIIDANFSVGSIYGIWPGKGVLHRTGREQVASAVAVYGPRTTLCIALPAASSSSDADAVLEVTLTSSSSSSSQWTLSRPTITLQPTKKIFAPGNLRATNDNARYASLVRYYLENRYTLRYTGGMVPDVYHAFAKSGGVFTNVSSTKARAKLRLLYEVAPLGLMVECAGGATTHESYDGSVLDVVIDDLDRRLGVCFGSLEEVVRFKDFMFGGDDGASGAGTSETS